MPGLSLQVAATVHRLSAPQVPNLLAGGSCHHTGRPWRNGVPQLRVRDWHAPSPPAQLMSTVPASVPSGSLELACARSVPARRMSVGVREPSKQPDHQHLRVCHGSRCWLGGGVAHQPPRLCRRRPCCLPVQGVQSPPGILKSATLARRSQIACVESAVAGATTPREVIL